MFLHDSLVDRVCGREPNHAHWLLLSHAVAAVHRLLIRRRVEVGVVDDDRVRGRQIDPEATGARREQEAADGLVLVENVDHPLAIGGRVRAVEAPIAEPEVLHQK